MGWRPRVEWTRISSCLWLGWCEYSAIGSLPSREQKQRGTRGLQNCKSEQIISLLEFLHGSPLPTGQSKFPRGIKALTTSGSPPPLPTHLPPIPTVQPFGIAGVPRMACLVSCYTFSFLPYFSHKEISFLLLKINFNGYFHYEVFLITFCYFLNPQPLFYALKALWAHLHQGTFHFLLASTPLPPTLWPSPHLQPLQVPTLQPVTS